MNDELARTKPNLGNTMNKRQLQRSKSKKHTSHKQFNDMAKQVALCATRGESTLEHIGNFIFFSSTNGEAWMVDHRENIALRLAEYYELLPYRIHETKKTFEVEWTEQFQIHEDSFITNRNGKQSVFFTCPVKEITNLISMLSE